MKKLLTVLMICSVTLMLGACSFFESLGKDPEPIVPSGPQTPVEPENPDEEPDYGLGDYENENEEDWWNKPENSEISGETIPY